MRWTAFSVSLARSASFLPMSDWGSKVGSSSISTNDFLDAVVDTRLALHDLCILRQRQGSYLEAETGEVEDPHGKNVIAQGREKIGLSNIRPDPEKWMRSYRLPKWPQHLIVSRDDHVCVFS